MPSTSRESIISTAASSNAGSLLVLTSSRIWSYCQATSCAPLITLPAKGVVAIQSVMNPMAWLLRVRSVLAAERGRYPSSSIAFWIVARVPALTLGWSLSTRETVPIPTPACRAIS